MEAQLHHHVPACYLLITFACDQPLAVERGWRLRVFSFFRDTGARNDKPRVYEMVEHSAARVLTRFLLVRGGVIHVAYARAIGKRQVRFVLKE